MLKTTKVNKKKFDFSKRSWHLVIWQNCIFIGLPSLNNVKIVYTLHIVDRIEFRVMALMFFLIWKIFRYSTWNELVIDCEQKYIDKNSNVFILWNIFNWWKIQKIYLFQFILRSKKKLKQQVQCSFVDRKKSWKTRLIYLFDDVVSRLFYGRTQIWGCLSHRWILTSGQWAKKRIENKLSQTKNRSHFDCAHFKTATFTVGIELV